MMKKTNKSMINNILKMLKEAWENPQKKAIIMLVVMFIFIVFVVSNIKENTSNIHSINTKSSGDFQFNLDKINQKNYHFKYIVNIDNQITLYEGDCYKEKELFTKNLGEQFYKLNDTYLNNNNGIWTKTTTPYLLDEFKNIENIELILKNATFESKTENKDQITSYSYSISTTTLIKKLELNNIDIDDIPNKINLTTDKDNNVEKIEYDLSPYGKYKNYSINNINASIEYSNFGTIKEMEDPE